MSKVNPIKELTGEDPEFILLAPIEAGKDIALAAKNLVELDRNVDIEFTINNLQLPNLGTSLSINRAKFKQLLPYSLPHSLS